MKSYPYTKLTIVFLLHLGFLFHQHANAQGQSGRVYEFVNLPATARITALGGYAVPAVDNDLGMALYYPSLIGPNLDNQISFNFVNYFGDINYGTAAFSKGFERTGNLTMAVQYINYGLFSETDEYGNSYGEFGAAEYAVSLGWGRSLNEKISIGSNIKALTSHLERYTSFGLAADVAVSYMDTARMLATSLVFRNIGRQIIQHGTSNEALPFDIVFGASKKLINAPLRFSLVAHNLHIYDLTYDELETFGQFSINEPSAAPTAQERFEEASGKVLRHLVLGMEFVPSENFILGLGYNYRRRQEMKVDSRISTVGLSWGIGVKISRFMFHYGRSNYHLAGAPNHFSISTNLEDLFFRPRDVPSIR